MPRAKRSIQSEVTIDGFALVWRLHREQQFFSPEGWTGMAIHVVRADGLVRKELFLEYPAEDNQKPGQLRVDWSIQQKIVPARVEAHIREAMEAGWDPDARGKPFVHELEELPS